MLRGWPRPGPLTRLLTRRLKTQTEALKPRCLGYEKGDRTKLKAAVERRPESTCVRGQVLWDPSGHGLCDGISTRGQDIPAGPVPGKPSVSLPSTSACRLASSQTIKWGTQCREREGQAHQGPQQNERQCKLMDTVRLGAGPASTLHQL